MPKNSNPPSKQQNKYYAVDASRQLDATQVSAIVNSLRLYFQFQDNPPADEIIIYPQSVCKDEFDAEHYNASVKLVVDYCGPKVHKINLKFKINKQNNCLPSTLTYV